MGQHPSHRSPAAGLLSCQLFTDCCSKKRGRYWAVKMALSQPFLGMLLKWNKSTHFLNISISYIFYIIYFWINLHLHIVPIYLELVFCFVFCIAGTKRTNSHSELLSASLQHFINANNFFFYHDAVKSFYGNLHYCKNKLHLILILQCLYCMYFCRRFK